ncbi:MAG: hypothetical protein NDI61_11320 [Bdellovibrionaceae bacterium]|nr:hypothetical protein [Pseudobdellovibrionaceae bacterium]
MKNTILFISVFCFVSSGFAASKGRGTCPEGTYAITGHSRKAYMRADGTYVKSTNVKASCRRRSKSYDFWNHRFSDGRPDGWPHRGEKSVAWTEEEKERFYEAMASLPDLFQIESMRTIYRMKQSWYPPNPATHANGILVLYDAAFSTKGNLARYLAHELSHEIFRSLPDGGESYADGNGWRVEREGDKFVWSGRKSGYVDEDGANSRSEDFANNIEFYLFEPEKLRKTTPEAFKWIQKQYGAKLGMKGAEQ